MSAPRITMLAPEGFRRAPWKNGGGVTTSIAEAYPSGQAPDGWDGLLWQFGRTSIVAAGPFSDLTGYDRLQVLVRGRGLVLDVDGRGEIDVRTPWSPVRFRGEERIVSRLEDGPVEVVNLIADRARFEVDLQVARAGSPYACLPGAHIFYAADAPATVTLEGEAHAIAADHALRIDVAEGIIKPHPAGDGLLIASIRPKLL